MSEDPNNIDSNENEAPPSNSSDNRGFILAVGVLAGIFLLALVAMAVVGVVIIPRNRAQESTRVALINDNNTATVFALTDIAAKSVKTATSTPLQPTATLTSTATIKPSATKVVAVATNTTNPLLAGVDPRTATVSALLTQAAEAKTTITTTVFPSSTALPTTGFIEDAGIPTLLGVAAFLVVVIFLVRRMRASSAA